MSTYTYTVVSEDLDRVLKDGDRTVAWIRREQKSPPKGSVGSPYPVYAVYRAGPSDDAFGRRVGERGSHHAAFTLAVNRCG